MPPRLAPSLSLLLLLSLTVLVYAPGLSGPPILDDHSNLAPLAALKSPGADVGAILFANESGPLGRPIAMATFAADYLVGDGSTRVFKTTSLAIHLITGVLLFVLTGMLLRRAGTTEWHWALWVTAAWLLAPLWVSTVLYIVQRMAQLATLFALMAMIAYVRGRERVAVSPVRGMALISSAFLLWTPLAALGKETGLVTPLLLLLIELFFFDRRTETRLVRRVVPALFLLTVALPALGAVAYLATHPHLIADSYADRDMTALTRLLSEGRVVAAYLFHLVFPLQAPTFGVFHDDFVVSDGLLSPPDTALAAAFWLSLPAIAWLLTRAGLKPLAFGLLFFAAGHLLESTIAPLELYFEHRNYLPATGLFIGLGWTLAHTGSRLRSKRISLLWFLLPLVAGGATLGLTATWSSEAELVAAAVRHHPGSVRAHAQMANVYAKQGQIGPALAHLQTVAELSRGLAWGIRLHRLMLLCEAGVPIPEDAYRPEPVRGDGSRADLVYAMSSLSVLNSKIDFGACPALDLRRLRALVHDWMASMPDERNGMVRQARTHGQAAYFLIDKALAPPVGR